MLKDEESFGFIVVDGNGALFAKLSGNTPTVLYKFSVDLPNQHRRGGFSANRFSRGREIARHNYLRKVAEKASDYFLSDNVVNVQGIVLAGSADFKSDLHGSDLFDPRLKEKVLKVVNCEDGQEKGLDQAITGAQDALGGVKLVREKKLLDQFSRQVELNSAAYGVADVVAALEMSAVDTIILFEDLDVRMDDSRLAALVTQEDGVDDEGHALLLTEWMAQHHRQFGADVALVSDASEEGTKFVSFGGIGALLRWPVDFQQLAELNEDVEENELAE